MLKACIHKELGEPSNKPEYSEAIMKVTDRFALKDGMMLTDGGVLLTDGITLSDASSGSQEKTHLQTTRWGSSTTRSG